MTNPSKLEQVARALQEQAPKGSFLTSADYWLVMARAAIAAMELPTEEMVEIGEGMSDFILPDVFDNSLAGRRKEMAMAYSQMIRVALKHEKPE